MLTKIFASHICNYLLRISRWYKILINVKGCTPKDQLILVASALASLFYSLRNLNKWQDPVLLCDITVNVKEIGIFKLRHRTDDLWHIAPNREHAVLNAILQRLRPGDTFFDAGANIGFYTILAAKLVGDKGRVIAVEMMPDTVAILRNHLKLNRLANVQVIDRALSDEPGSRVTASVMKGKYGQASIAGRAVEGSTAISVETTTIDEIIKNEKNLSLLKMDLEGSEKLAIIGAGDTLNRIQSIIFEDLGEEGLSNFLQTKGFETYRLDGNNCIATSRNRCPN
jgi:FkbM family methyltransferase